MKKLMVECPNFKEKTEVRKTINLFGEKMFMIHCRCNSIYTSKDKLHWSPIVISNEKAIYKVVKVGREYDEG